MEQSVRLAVPAAPGAFSRTALASLQGLTKATADAGIAPPDPTGDAGARQVMDGNAMVIVSGPDGRIREVSEKFLHATGYRREELLGMIAERLYADEGGVLCAEIRETTGQGRIWSGAPQVRAANGHLLGTRCVIVPVLDPDGRSRRNVALHLELTGARLTQMEHMIASAFNKMREAVYVVDPATQYLCFMNDFALHEQGWCLGEIGTRTMADTDYHAEKQVIDDLFRMVESDGKGSALFQSDHGARTCEAQAYAITTETGHHRILLLLRDISLQAKAERDRKELLAVITHELRTPLTSIKGALELLKAGAVGALSEQANSLVTIAANNSERMLGLIRDILDMEEIGQDSFEIESEPVDLSALVRNAIEAHRGYGAHLGVSFIDGGTTPGVFVLAEPVRLAQVLSNLLSNAAKVTAPGGTIEIWASREAGCGVIYVRDHGPGIPLQLRDKLFSRFTKSEAPNRSRVSGSGLGLSIVKTIVEKLDGEISFSTETGKGTTFRVALPSL